MGRFIPRWNSSEAAAVKLVPETCDLLDRAIDEAFKTPDFSDERVTTILAKYGIEPSKNLGHALAEIVSPLLFAKKADLTDTIKYEVTFPLRQALVQQIAWQLTPVGPHPQNYVDRWLRDWELQKQHRKSKELS